MWAKASSLWGKATKRGLCSIWVGIGGVLGSHLDRASSFHQGNTDSGLVSACTWSLCEGRAQHRHPSSCPSSPCSEAKQFSYSLYVAGTFQAAVPSLEFRMNVCEWMNLCLGPLRGRLDFSAVLGLIWMEFLLIFSARYCGDYSSWLWCSRLQSLMWDWDPSLLRGELHNWHNPPYSQWPHVGVRPACFASPLLSIWLPLYILCYNSSIQLVSRWFSKEIVLYFSCNFDVVGHGRRQMQHLPTLPSWLEVLHVFLFCCLF